MIINYYHACIRSYFVFTESLAATTADIMVPGMFASEPDKVGTLMVSNVFNILSIITVAVF